MAIQGGTGAERSGSGLGFCGGALLALAGATSCTWLPNEFNLSPIYRQRLAEDGEVLELDVLWPFFHYELTPDGGDDFRIRPFYRYVSEPDQPAAMSPGDGEPNFGAAAVEHQFAWPLGRYREDEEQSLFRLFPFWSHTSRIDDLGLRETDWYLIFPFIWGGSREDGQEDYFGIFPIYTDFPDFFTYGRFRSILFPLYLGLEKQGQTTHMLAWPFIGWANGPRGHWHRVLPLYSYRSTPWSEYLSILWPFLHYGTELRDTEDPLTHWMVWPLVGRRWSDTMSAWTFFWPFFEYVYQSDRGLKLNILWPFFHFERDDAPVRQLWQWWLWPLVARTITDNQQAWNFLWPLIWLREYDDPDGLQTQDWFVPFYKHVHRDRADGTEDDFTQIWPLWHRESNHDGTGDWSLLSFLPWRSGMAYGTDEAYDWLWTLVKGRRRTPSDTSVEAIANLYTSRTRGETTQASVPLLFNYESDGDGSVVRLFQFLPIWWSSAGDADAAEDDS